MIALDLSQIITQSDAECANNDLCDSLKLPLLRTLKQAIAQHGYPFQFQDNNFDCFDVDSYLAHASNLIDAKLAATAEILLLGILNIKPSSEKAMSMLAHLNEINNSYKRTVDYARVLAPQACDNSEIVYQNAFALHKLGRHDEAVEVILPLYICENTPRVARLYGLVLKSLGQLSDAITILSEVINDSPDDIYSIRALSEIYTESGMYNKSLELLSAIPPETIEDGDRLGISLLYRSMGELELAIQLNAKLINEVPGFPNALWTQCFNYSIASSHYATDLIETSRDFWSMKRKEQSVTRNIVQNISAKKTSQLRIAFLSSDIGEHVVSRFLAPILRNYDRDRYHISLLSTLRRFEDKASKLVGYADEAIALNELEPVELSKCMDTIQADVIIDTNGFTRNSGISLLVNRCAPIQCHYIGYHATTGLDTIDYFLGDSVTVPPEFQKYFTEKLVQIPSLWMAYDNCIDFPPALATAKRECLVMGSFSQVTKINDLTLEFWASALNEVTNSILVIKDRGINCSLTRSRIESTLQSLGVNPERVYMFGPVASHFEHLDSYNAIDIALDTTPWSGATTAFEALGMGVPLVAIRGDTTSGRMSTSVVSAAGMDNLISATKEEFASIVANLAVDYKGIRANKADLQRQIRAGILFDGRRICNDFCGTVEYLATTHARS